MKKKIIIPIIVCLVIVIGIIGFIIWNNRTVSTITLDINPSIEINLDRNEKVKSIIALNDDAKDILDDNYKGKSLDDTFEILITNLVEKGYVNKENELDVVLYVDGKITNKMVSEKIEFEFGKKEIHTEIVTIDNVTKEDEKLAKEYNVSPAKIAYIKTIVKEKKSLSLREKRNLLLSVLFSVVSLGVGFIVAFYGKGNSYIETELITAIITLFGFGLTATVFVYQAFEKSNSNEKKSVICALSKTLLLTLCLVVVSLILDFAVSIVTINVVKVILSTVMYASLVYSTICQFDILNSFVVIITNDRKSDRNKDE